MVLKPILDSLEISFKSETPFTKEPRIRGTAISFKELIKMFPNGFIQFAIKVAPQVKLFKTNARTTPKIIPKTICQCSASFLRSEERRVGKESRCRMALTYNRIYDMY